MMRKIGWKNHHTMAALGLFIFAALLTVGFPQEAKGQPGLCIVTGCQTDADCVAAGCPGCFTCTPGVGCGPNPANCDDNNDCTSDECLPLIAPFTPTVGNSQGCIHTSDALPPPSDPNLATECYLCEFDGNGVCEPGNGETCAGSPDCQTDTAASCTTPPLPATCSTANIGTFGDPFPLDACSDGDVCTDDLCTVGGAGVTCSNPDKTCIALAADGCCPVGCVGPDPQLQCAVVFPPDPNNTCDPDCWPVPVCGDEFVQPPGETCDDGLPGADAGIRPDGTTPVTKTECRDPGAANPCTYCGDGVLDSPSEECDGTALGQCTTCVADCTCGIEPPPVTGLCLTGSGLISGDEPAPQCSCSLNPELAGQAVSVFNLLSMLGVFLVPAYWAMRKRK